MMYKVGDRVEIRTGAPYPNALGRVVGAMELFPKVWRYIVQPDPVMSYSGQAMELRRVSVLPGQLRRIHDLEELAQAL